ncbi:MAG: metal dependent phosphohydrolase [uncultured bacterium]|nr:MAG: metal dependent phosphohydrolase [uncultured bacterium]
MDYAEIQKTISQMVTQFTAAIQNAGIYPADHPQVLSYINETHRLLAELFRAKRAITLLLIGDSLMVERRPLPISGACEKAFVQILRDNSLERVSFNKGLSLDQLDEFIRNLSSATLSAMRSSRYIRFGKLDAKDPDDRDEDDDDSPAETEQILDLQTLTTEDRIKNIFSDTLAGGEISPEDSDEIVRHFMDNIHREANPLRLLAETKSNDEYTFTHTANVGILTLFLAEHLGFKGSALSNMGVAAILHDVGKVKTPDAILSKQGPLTPDEREVMETHALNGALKLMEQENITNVAVLGALEHHMKYDGTGYPRVKGIREQSIVGQIISIADVYDAMRTTRPYRPDPMPMDRIIQTFRSGSGTDFNPYLVERFLNLVDK